MSFTQRRSRSAPAFPATTRKPQTLDALDFVARLLAHVPDPRRHPVHCYGAFSSVERGKLKAQSQAQQSESLNSGPGVHPPPPPACASPSSAALRRGWAQLPRRSYEIDPLVRPRRQRVMRVVFFHDRRTSHPPRPRPPWRLRPPRYPRSRSASGSRPGSRFPLIPLTAGAVAPASEAGPRPRRPHSGIHPRRHPGWRRTALAGASVPRCRERAGRPRTRGCRTPGRQPTRCSCPTVLSDGTRGVAAGALPDMAGPGLGYGFSFAISPRIRFF